MKHEEQPHVFIKAFDPKSVLSKMRSVSKVIHSVEQRKHNNELYLNHWPIRYYKNRNKHKENSTNEPKWKVIQCPLISRHMNVFI